MRYILPFIFVMISALQMMAYNEDDPREFIDNGVAYRINDDNSTLSIIDRIVAIPYQEMGCTFYDYINYPDLESSIAIPETISKDAIVYTVTRVADNAFKEARTPNYIKLPKTIESIGANAFSAGHLSGIEIPADSRLKTIGDGAFGANYYSMTSIVLPDSVEVIGNSVFGNCMYLESVSLPKHLRSLGNKAFFQCYHLTEITLPDSLEYIGDEAFYRSNITAITIPENVKHVGQYALNCADNYSLRTIYWNAVACETAYKACTNSSGYDMLQDFIIGDKVEKIPAGLLYGTGISSVELPNSLLTIGDEAFRNCYSLTSVVIPDKVTTVGARAFAYCSGLKSLTVGEAVTFIGENAFYQFLNPNYPESPSIEEVIWKARRCRTNGEFITNNLSRVEVADGVEIIPDNFIADAKAVTSVAIPASVEAIGGKAFYECANLSGKLFIPEHVEEIGELAFCGTNYGSISVDAKNTFFDSRDNCNALIDSKNSILLKGCDRSFIPEGVDTIAQKAFYNCGGLRGVIIPHSAKYLGANAFEDCSSLQTLVLGENLSRIDTCAFKGCRALKDVYNWRPRPTSITDDVFEDELWNQATLYVPTGFLAVYWANNSWNNAFNNIVEWDPHEITIDVQNGDLNGDGETNVGDVSRLYGAILSGDDDATFDLNGDGNVNTGDASELYRIILGQ